MYTQTVTLSQYISGTGTPQLQLFTLKIGASLVARVVKNLPATQETWLQPLGQEAS